MYETTNASFITPAKVLGLLMCEIWALGHVPNAALPTFLSLLTSLIGPEYERSLQQSSAQRPIGRKAKLEDQLQDVKLEDFHAILSRHLTPSYYSKDDTPNATLWHLLAWFALGLTTFDDLFRQFYEAIDLFSEPYELRQNDNSYYIRAIVPNTPIGLWVRRMHWEFDILPFRDQMRIWYSFKVFIESMWDRSSPFMVAYLDIPFKDNDGERGIELDPNDMKIQYAGNAVIRDDMDKVYNQPETRSIADVEVLLEFCIQNMARRGGYVHERIRKDLKSLLEQIQDLSTVGDYARFIQAWYTGDYDLAQEHMHRYYDWAMRNNQFTRVYPLVCLQEANLHATFECYTEAVRALNEAIGSAKEHKDKYCLKYCMTWAQQLQKNNSAMVKLDESVNIVQAHDTAVRYLCEMKDHPKDILIAGLLGQARLALSDGTALNKARESLYAAEHHAQDPHTKDYTGAFFMLRAKIASKMGLFDVSYKLHKKANAYADDRYNYRNLCAAVFDCAQKGQWDRVEYQMQYLKTEAGINIENIQYLSRVHNILLLQQAILSNDHPTAHRLLADFAASPVKDTDLTTKLTFLRIDLLARQGSFTEALALIDKDWKETKASSSPDIEHEIRLMIMKARLFARMGNGAKGFTVATRALRAATRLGYVVPRVEAAIALAGVFCAVGDWGGAAGLLDGVVGDVGLTKDEALKAEHARVCYDTMNGKLLETRDKDGEEAAGLANMAKYWTLEAGNAYYALADTRGCNDMRDAFLALTKTNV